ncbi:MAG: hypothetical protein ACJ74Z_20085 [Bryobacteraceae bacterium]
MYVANARAILPVIRGGAYGFERVNVAEQRRDPNSLLNWTERLIRMRKEVPEIGWGDFEVLRTGTWDVLAIRYDWRNNSVVVVHNLSAIPHQIWLNGNLKGEDSNRLANILFDGAQHCKRMGQALHFARALWVSLVSRGRLEYLLKRINV